ncbi:MAG: hypothetical protein L6Q98_21685 [Anaerolineae bacterium]|nr:hypothetical protein [Anaerolineae bacterium]NUQ06663.1 hypothetical protein [Anaerolineae bacterium]
MRRSPLENPEQPSLFRIPEVDTPSDLRETKPADYGTFKDSLRAPVHSWFRYPAGFSYRFVDAMIDRFGIVRGDWVYDPFSGTGTTLIGSKQQGINGYGVEAHSFVHWVASVKLFWEFDLTALADELGRVLAQAREHVHLRRGGALPGGAFPELVYKCYHPDTLYQLFLLRQYVQEEISDTHLRNLAQLALTDTLRTAAAAGTGWPYIAPNKNTGEKPARDALGLFAKTLTKMAADLTKLPATSAECEIRNVLGDSRQRQALDDGQIGLALTSPPYLNNYDYADRTRLETYFWGITKTWKDITEQFRDKLMVAATTQVVRKRHDVETALSEEVRDVDEHVYAAVQKAVIELSSLRLKKGGKKDYDLMVALYFNDMLLVLQETYRVLRAGGRFCVVLGDSAPYGVYIPTHDLVGKLGLGLGFRRFDYEEFRTRGDKWKANPQRHRVQLREGVVILQK